MTRDHLSLLLTGLLLTNLKVKSASPSSLRVHKGAVNRAITITTEKKAKWHLCDQLLLLMTDKASLTIVILLKMVVRLITRES